MDLQQVKHQLLLKMLDEGKTMIHFDTRPSEVIVPDVLKSGKRGTHPGAVSLNFSYLFGLSDLEVKEEYIEATLSFSRESSFCHIPLRFIWGMSHPDDASHKIVFFEEDCPKDIVFAVPSWLRLDPVEALTGCEEQEEVEEEKSVPFLQVIKGGRLN